MNAIQLDEEWHMMKDGDKDCIEELRIEFERKSLATTTYLY